MVFLGYLHTLVGLMGHVVILFLIFKEISILFSIVALTVKNKPAMREIRLRFLSWESPLEKGMATHFSIFGEFHGQRSLAGHWGPWGHKESDVTDD